MLPWQVWPAEPAHEPSREMAPDMLEEAEAEAEAVVLVDVAVTGSAEDMAAAVVLVGAADVAAAEYPEFPTEEYSWPESWLRAEGMEEGTLAIVGLRFLPALGGPLKSPALQASRIPVHLSSQMLQLSPPVGGELLKQSVVWSEHALLACGKSLLAYRSCE